MSFYCVCVVLRILHMKQKFWAILIWFTTWAHFFFLFLTLHKYIEAQNFRKKRIRNIELMDSFLVRFFFFLVLFLSFLFNFFFFFIFLICRAILKMILFFSTKLSMRKEFSNEMKKKRVWNLIRNCIHRIVVNLYYGMEFKQ